MQNKLIFAVTALCYASLAFAQNSNTGQGTAKTMDESAFTFTEAQLGEDDNMSQNVTILNSNTNVYASEVGFRFSPMRFRFRALSPDERHGVGTVPLFRCGRTDPIHP